MATEKKTYKGGDYGYQVGRTISAEGVKALIEKRLITPSLLEWDTHFLTTPADIKEWADSLQHDDGFFVIGRGSEDRIQISYLYPAQGKDREVSWLTLTCEEAIEDYPTPVVDHEFDVDFSWRGRFLKWVEA
jgi:hypothetical protein